MFNYFHGLLAYWIIAFQVAENNRIVKKVLWQLRVCKAKFHAHSVVLLRCFCADERNIIAVFAVFKAVFKNVLKMFSGCLGRILCLICDCGAFAIGEFKEFFLRFLG